MNQEIFEKFADLILESGINMKEGSLIKVTAEPCHWDFILALQKKAYQKGAKHFRADMIHPMMEVNASHHLKDEYLNYLPSYTEKMVDSFVEEKWSMIRFDGKENPDLAKNIDQKRNGVIQKAQRESLLPLSKSLGAGKATWLVSALPTMNWASKIFNEPASEALLKKLWETLIPILRLNEKDPVAAWKEHSKILHSRCQHMDSLNPQYLHFEGPNTNLKVYMTERSKWVGGACKSEDGQDFFPNLPTEEIFTTPHYAKTSGRVAVTRPVNVLGDQVENAWFEFKEGKVVDYGATYGKHLLDEYFKMDELARYLGEVALVDVSAPIYKSGLIFHSILFDENASCHIALGRGIPMAIKEADGLKDEELYELGCNKSMLHTDFMIGSEEVSVTAVSSNGQKIKVIDKGHFVI